MQSLPAVSSMARLLACKGLLRGLSESVQSAVVLQVIAGPTALHQANSVSETTTNYRIGMLQNGVFLLDRL
ncbi:MAG: hypothetical protein EOM24_02730 [Chloroflexia bacterium]|nr:hypothetical protein [Chloroflexia bacterium]